MRKASLIGLLMFSGKVTMCMFSGKGLSLFEKVKSIDIRQSLDFKLLLLRIERSQLRWYGHVIRMSYDRTAK